MKKDLVEVHFLRAFASLMVCIYHIFVGNGNLFPGVSFVKSILSFGYLGVEVFFILSGFIICYSFPYYYQLKNYDKFLIRRISRIEPPYIISIFVVILLNYLSYTITGKNTHIDWINVAYHFAYLNNFGLGSYLNVVYWTLGIEFQFYLIIGLLFPLANKYKPILIGILSVFFVASCIKISPASKLIIPYLSIFGLGIATYFFKIKQKFNVLEFSIITGLFLLQIFLFLDLPTVIACVLSISVLLFYNMQNKLVRFLSLISFSLYLMHVPVGGKVINIGLRFVHSTFDRYILFFIALIVSIGAAILFYFSVEKPFISLSKKVVYKSA